MSRDKYCKVYIPLKFLLFNLVLSIFIVSLGFIFEVANFNYEVSNLITNYFNSVTISTVVIIYGFYSVIASIVVFSINILVQMKNTENKVYIFIFSILPMNLMCVAHIALSIYIFDFLFSLLLLLPCVYVIVTILFERGTFYHVSSRVLRK